MIIRNKVLSRIVFLVLLLVLLSLAVLTGKAFHPYRVTLWENTLSQALNYPVHVDGDVRFDLSPSPAIIATDLRISSYGFPDTHLATLKSLRVPIDLHTLLDSDLVFPVLEAHDLSLKLLRAEDGTTSWLKQTAAESTKSDGNRSFGVIEALSRREIHLAGAEVFFRDSLSGLELDFGLEKFTVSRALQDGMSVFVTYGEINGELFELTSRVSSGLPFETNGRIGELRFELNENTTEKSEKGAFEGMLLIETSDFQNLLDVLRLDGDAPATGKLVSRVKHKEDQLRFEDLDLDLLFSDGNSARARGSIEHSNAGYDLDLFVDVDFAKNQDLTFAERISDIRTRSISAHVLGEKNVFEIVDLDLTTNAFGEHLRKIGPFRIGRISRTPDNGLQIVNFVLELGPEEAPILTARADVKDILALEEILVSGELNLPAERVVLTLAPEQARQLGNLVGTMSFSGSLGEEAKVKVDLQSTDTALWNVQASFSWEDMFNAGSFIGNLNVGIQDGAAFLKALDLSPINTGRLGISLEFEKIKKVLKSAWQLTLGGSQVQVQLSSQILQGAPVVWGRIESDKAAIQDLQNVLLATLEVYQAMKTSSKLRKQKGGEDEFQPLVLPEKEIGGVNTDDLSDFQPLVLENADAAIDEPLSKTEGDLSDFQPLVLSEGLGNLSLNNLKNPKNLAREIDIEMDLVVRRLTGQEGINDLKSRLNVKNGMLKFGPLAVRYGGGQATVSASMNFIDAPGWLRLVGRTGGWDLGKILKSFNVGVGASGILTGSFDVLGQTGSLANYAESMRGQVTVEMRDGKISTSLIELAGLGILPWLFSQEILQGYANIACIRAPLEVNRGLVETSSLVMETRRVQLVASGSLDIVRDNINLKAVPRPIGRPLARSAFPFTIVGKLSNPEVRVSRGGARRARVPVEMQGQRIPCVPDDKQLVRPSIAP